MPGTKKLNPKFVESLTELFGDQENFIDFVEKIFGTRCVCEAEMEFFGVDGNGGRKFNCPKCYKKIIIP